MAPTRTDAGITLLELLIALAIAALLAAISYPSYRQQLLRAHRTEAIESLLAIAAAQERHHLAAGRYAETLAAAGGAGLSMQSATVSGRYDLQLEDTAPDRYVAVATPVAGGPQAADRRCARLAIQANGQRTAADAAGRDTTPECWR